MDARPPSTPAEWSSYYDLRWRVLRAPWDQPCGSERDDREADSFHLGVWDRANRAVAVGRLQLNSETEAQVRFMAVDPAHSRRGLGSLVLQRLETRAADLGATVVTLNARQEAQEFYRKHGYRVRGPAPLLFGTIPHFKMEKPLNPQSDNTIT